jgi:hypothetical protein
MTQDQYHSHQRGVDKDGGGHILGVPSTGQLVDAAWPNVSQNI